MCSVTVKKNIKQKRRKDKSCRLIKIFIAEDLFLFCHITAATNDLNVATVTMTHSVYLSLDLKSISRDIINSDNLGEIHRDENHSIRVSLDPNYWKVSSFT